MTVEWNAKRTYPFIPRIILCRAGLHCSQKYSSGLIASSIKPTQPPCCQTWHLSHWMKKLPASSGGASVTSSVVAPFSSLIPALGILWLGSREIAGGPGYSEKPQTHLVTSSASTSSSSSSSTGALLVSSLSTSTPRLLLRVANESP